MATGLNFQTQTIINSLYDVDSNNAPLVTTDGSGNDAHVKILRDFDFFKNNEKGRVVSIYNRAGYNPVNCSATIDLSEIEDLIPDTGKKYYRLDVYVGVEGAEPFIYSNQWVYKGRPFWIELTTKAGQTVDKVAEQWVKEIKKSKMFLIDKDIMHVTADASAGADSELGTEDDVYSGKIILTGAGEFQRLRKIELSVYDENSEYAEKIAEIGDDAITVTEYGKNGFGTYSQIVKDLRLPTAANTSWTHIRQSETPIVGALYDQFIVNYAAPAVNDGMQCVGQRMESHTTHVFWVKSDIASDFKEYLETLATVTPAVTGEGTV